MSSDLWENQAPGRVRRRRSLSTRRRKGRRGARSQRKFSPKLKWGLAALLGFGFLVVNWWLPHYQNIQNLKGRIAGLEERKQTLENQNQELQDQINWLGTEAAVERLAREELGMIKPGEQVLIRVQP